MRVQPAPIGKSSTNVRERRTIRAPVLLAGALLLAFGALLFFRFSNGERPPTTVVAESPLPVAPEADDAVTLVTNAAILPAPAPPAAPPPQRAVPEHALTTAPTYPPPSPATRALVANLALLDLKGRKMTPELVAWWRSQYDNLKKSGDDGVSAIREFLARNEDVPFDGLSGGFPSLRMALLDALGSIGGQAGIDGSLEILRTTSLPTEIAQLAQNLETLAPEQYRREFLDATRAVLAQAQAGGLKGYDVGALFQILTRYGGADAVADLESAGGNWKFYQAISLGSLPDDAGIPSLIELARRSSKSAAIAAWSVVAEHAAGSTAARTALLDAARAGSVPPRAWSELARALGGYDYYISASPSSMPSNVSFNNSFKWHYHGTDEHFIAVVNVAPLSSEEINTRLGLIDQLTALNPPDEARTLLANGRNVLVNELQRRQK